MTFRIHDRAAKKLVPDSLIKEARREVFEIREGILARMDEHRGRL